MRPPHTRTNPACTQERRSKTKMLPKSLDSPWPSTANAAICGHMRPYDIAWDMLPRNTIYWVYTSMNTHIMNTHIYWNRPINYCQWTLLCRELPQYPMIYCELQQYTCRYFVYSSISHDTLSIWHHILSIFTFMLVQAGICPYMVVKTF